MHKCKTLGNLFFVIGGSMAVGAGVLWFVACGAGNVQRVQSHSGDSRYNCGIECVCYMAAFLGLDIKPNEIRRIGSKYLDDNAISLDEMSKLCEEVGLGKTMAIQVDVEDLGFLVPPFVVHQTRGGIDHFVVCSRVSDNYVQLVDLLSDGGAVSTVAKGAFKRDFSGYALVLAPR